jgi:hypothetical protein
MAGDPLFKAGMVTDATWCDVDNDGWTDLVLAGDWMPVSIFRNEQGKKFTDYTTTAGLDRSNGWWCKIIPADIDHDGDIDFIAGNLGTNTQFKTNEQEPLVTYAGDFNDDGRIVPVMTWFIQNNSYPFNSRDELLEQIPSLKKKFIKYADYGKAMLGDILTSAQVEKARKLYIYNTQTSVLINNGGKFTCKALPAEAQFSMMSAILYKDFDGDGKEDILLAGNFYPFRVQQGRCDAGLGTLLKGDGKGNFIAVNRTRTGLCIKGDIRDITELKGRQKNTIVISKNNDTVQVLTQP